jgi:anthranilate synthase/phosphoribosyltransferase
MYVLIDNYDSFTYNVYQYLAECTDEPIEVYRNDVVTAEKIENMDPRAIVLSPGPGRPEDAGVSVELVRRFAGRKPILGICLGHQAIGAAFGARIGKAKRIVHGKCETMTLDGQGLFRAIPADSEFTRYHSLVIDPQTLPDDLEVTAYSHDREIMGVRHKQYPVEGIQFHPESMASGYGKKLLKNFLNYRRDPFRVKEMLTRVLDGSCLTREEAEAFMGELTEGNLSPAQIAGFLVALGSRPVAPEEIAGCAAVLQQKRVALTHPGPVLDIVGTGGDGAGTFNISSLAALTAAACGAVVAKHGNRAVSSLSGSADFYKSLGIRIDLSPGKAEELLSKTGFSFLFAPLYHGAMKYAAAPRRELGVKTVMNLLGPLANPAASQYQLIGVFAHEVMRPVAEAAVMLGLKRGMVVHSRDGLDEISVSAPTDALIIHEDGGIEEYTIDPRSLGIPSYSLEELLGGSAEENAALAEELLAGGGRPALLDAIALNAGAGLFVYGLAKSVEQGYRRAREALTGGQVKQRLAAVVGESRALAQTPG